MRIADQDAETLHIFTKPSRLVMLVGAFMVLLACVLALGPAKATTLTASRAGAIGVSEIVETKLLGTKRLVRIPMRLLRGAEARPMAWSAHTAYYRLYLDLADGDGPYYFAWYGGREQAEAHAAAINAYVASPSIKELRISNDKRGAYYVIAGLLAFLGLVFVFWGSQRIRATFSRPERLVRITWTGLLGTRHADFAMADIRTLDVHGLRGDCQLYLELASGRRVSLSTSTDTEGLIGPTRVRESRLKDAARLREFCQISGVA